MLEPSAQARHITGPANGGQVCDDTNGSLPYARLQRMVLQMVFHAIMTFPGSSQDHRFGQIILWASPTDVDRLVGPDGLHRKYQRRRAFRMRRPERPDLITARTTLSGSSTDLAQANHKSCRCRAQSSSSAAGPIRKTTGWNRHDQPSDAAVGEGRAFRALRRPNTQATYRRGNNNCRPLAEAAQPRTVPRKGRRTDQRAHMR